MADIVIERYRRDTVAMRYVPLGVEVIIMAFYNINCAQITVNVKRTRGSVKSEV